MMSIRRTALDARHAVLSEFPYRPDTANRRDVQNSIGRVRAHDEPDEEDDGVCCSRGTAEGRRVRDAFWPTIDGYMRCNHDTD